MGRDQLELVLRLCVHNGLPQALVKRALYLMEWEKWHKNLYDAYVFWSFHFLYFCKRNCRSHILFSVCLHWWWSPDGRITDAGTGKKTLKFVNRKLIIAITRIANPYGYKDLRLVQMTRSRTPLRSRQKFITITFKPALLRFSKSPSVLIAPLMTLFTVYNQHCSTKQPKTFILLTGRKLQAP